jgi:hypothetical protein
MRSGRLRKPRAKAAAAKAVLKVIVLAPYHGVRANPARACPHSGSADGHLPGGAKDLIVTATEGGDGGGLDGGAAAKARPVQRPAGSLRRWTMPGPAMRAIR